MMHFRPHALLIVLALCWGGCATPPPQAKPSTPTGQAVHSRRRTAPDPKPANDAQAASDAAAQMGILVADAFLGASKE